MESGELIIRYGSHLTVGRINGQNLGVQPSSKGGVKQKSVVRIAVQMIGNCEEADTTTTVASPVVKVCQGLSDFPDNSIVTYLLSSFVKALST